MKLIRSRALALALALLLPVSLSAPAFAVPAQVPVVLDTNGKPIAAGAFICVDLAGAFVSCGGGGGGGGAVTGALNAFVDGWDTTKGAEADPACGTDNGTCTQMALLKRQIQRTTSMIAALGSPFQAGGSIGNTGFNITGMLPAFAATPTFNLGTLNGAALASGQGYTAAANGTVATSVGANRAGAIDLFGSQSALIKDGSGNVYDFTQPAPVAGAVTTSAPTYTTGTDQKLSLDTAGALRVNVTAGGSSGVVAQGSTTSGQSGNLVQGAVTTAAPTYTTAQTSPLSLTTAGGLRVDGSGVTQPVSGTVTVNAGTNLNTSALALSANQPTAAAQASTTSGQTGPLVQGAVTTAPPSYTTAQTSPLSLDTAGNLRTNCIAGCSSITGYAQGSTTSGQLGPLQQLSVTTAAPTYTTGQTSPQSMDVHGSARNLNMDSAGAPIDYTQTQPTAQICPYPSTNSAGAVTCGVPETCASGNVANATVACTLATSVGKTTYITGFSMTAAGATAALAVSCTLTGTITGTMTYTYVYPAGAAVAGTPLIVPLSSPIPASATNTTIVVSCPASGAGGTNASISASGYQL